MTRPTVLLVVGMAGAGKSTFLHRTVSHLSSLNKTSYVMNLDPAVLNVPYPVDLDIRDTVNYRNVMREYNMGPNGGILTSLNLFATKFDQVLTLLREKDVDYIVMDTPGQIEIFTWSASGAVMTESLAAEYPVVVMYVMDTPRCVQPTTFMSNMLYACSILYKTQLPFVLVFNKTDIVGHAFAVEWMTDFEAFQRAVGNGEEEDGSYMDGLTRSMGLVLDEFYQSLRMTGVSSLTGAGMDDMLVKVGEAVVDYETDYVVMREQIMRERQLQAETAQQEQMERVMADLKVDE
jgi:hypothetical protein